MIKDIKYLIKRIIIGTGIALAVMTIKGNFMLQAHALQAISSWQMPAQESSVTTDTNAVFWYTNNTPFANQGDGELLFNFSIMKQYGDPTAPVLAPRFVRVHSGNDTYACYIGSSTVNNSTFTDGIYSAICPMHLESAGLTSVVVAFQNISTINQSNYIVKFNGLFTWKRDTEYTLLDAINNKLNNIGNSDVIANNNQNTQNIINNQNNNTQAIVDSQQDIKNTLNDSNVNNATNDASSFFGNFSSNGHGLSGIITAPLRLINSLTTATCNPLEFNLPIVGNHVVLPCMRPIYENYFGIFFSLWQLITTGLISYNVCINLYGKVRNLQNPNNDRIEVLNL